MSGFLKRYLRRPIGALFVAAFSCGLIATVLRFAGESERANGAGLCLMAVLVIQWAYGAFVREADEKGARIAEKETPRPLQVRIPPRVEVCKCGHDSSRHVEGSGMCLAAECVCGRMEERR